MNDDTQRIRLLISIVNYKTPELVCNLLDSLVGELSSGQDKVCVVDNASGDHSVEMISRHISHHSYQEFTDLIPSGRNGGFSYGNNVAMGSAIEKTPEYILLLNPDTMVKPGSIEKLVKFISERAEVGIVGGGIETDLGGIQRSAFRFHTILSELTNALRLGVVDKLLSRWQVPMPISPVPCQVDWVSGAFMLVRREVIEDVGLMDENYFLYFEEADYCLQASRHDWECWYYPDSRIVHYVGQSTGVVSGDVQRRRRPTYWFESRQRYFLKNHGVLYTLVADLVWGTCFAIWRIRRRIQNKPDLDPKYMLGDFWKNSLLFNLFNRDK